MSFTYMSRTIRPRDHRRTVAVKARYGPNWPTQRKKALERDNYTCVKCHHVGYRKPNGRWSVSVNHKRKIKLFVTANVLDWEAANDLSNLETLCEVCHKAADGHANLHGFVMLK